MADNTERFDAIVKADIKGFMAKMQQVDSMMRNVATGVVVKVKADVSNFMASMQAVQSKVNSVNGSDPTVNVNTNIAAALAQLQLIQAQANNLNNSNNTVHVQANTQHAIAELNRVRKQAEELAYSDVDVHVEVEAERALERFERIQDRIKQLEAMEPSVEVNADIREALRDLQMVEREIQMLTAKNRDIHVVADVTSALGQLRLVENVTRKLEADTTYVDIKTDAASTLAEIAHIRTQITQLDASDPTIDFHAETARFMARLAALQARIEALKADNEVRIDADTSRFSYKMALLRAQLLALNRSAIINIEARINNFQHAIGRLANNIRSFAEVAGYMIGGLFTSLLPMISPIIANIGALLGNLGVMIGLVGTQLTGLVFGIGTAAAGAGGVLAMAIGNVQKLYKEGEKLNAQQQEAKSAIDGIKSTYNDLVSKTEQPILAGVTKGAQAASSMMQILEPMFINSAKAFDGLMQSFKQSLGTPPVQKFIEYLNTSAGPMLTTFGKAIGNLFQGLGSMMVAFAPITQHVADGFLEMSNSFAQWASKLKESEKFKTFVSYFQTNMPKITSMFGDAIVGVVQFFSAFGTSASGMMTYLVDLMARWREWTSTLSENQAFQNFLSYVSSTAPSVMTLIGQLTTFLVNLGIGMAPLGAKLMELVNNFLAWSNTLMQNHPIVAQVIAIMTSLFGVFMAIMPAVLMFKALFAGLIPTLVSFASTIAGAVMNGIRMLIPMFTSLGPILLNVGTWFLNIASKILPLLGAAFTALSGPVGIAIAIITGLVTVGILLYQNWETVRSVLISVWESIKSAAISVWNAIKNTISNVMSSISSFLTSAWNTIKTTVTGTMNMLKTAIDNSWNAIKSTTTSVVNAIKSTVTSVWNAIKSAVTSVMESLKSAIAASWNAIKSAVTSAVNVIKSVVTSVWNAIKSTVTNVMNGIKTAVTSAWNAIKSTITSVMSAISSAVSSAWSAITSAVSSAVSAILSTVTSKFSSLVSAVSSAMSNVVSTIKSMWGQAQSFLSSIDLTGIGRNIMQGLLNGISAVGETVIAKAKSIASSVAGAIKGALNIHSPSRVTTYLGEMTGIGLANGITNKTRKAVQSATRVANAVIGATRTALDTHSPSRITTAIGSDVTQGLANGIEDNQKAATTSATKVANEATKAMEKAFNDKMKNLDLRLEAKAINTDTYVAEAKKLAKEYEAVTNATATVNAKIVKASEKEMKAASTAFSKQLTVLNDSYKAGEKDVKSYGDRLTALAKDFAHVEGASQKVGVQLKVIENELFKANFDNLSASYKNGEMAIEDYIFMLELMGENHSNVNDRMLKIDKELATARYELAKQTVDKIVANESMGATAQIKEIERIAAAYAVGTKQREQLDAEAGKVKEAMYNKLTAINDEYTQKIADAQKAEAEGVKKLNDEYSNALAQRSSALYSFAGIFDEVTKASDVSGQKLIDNLRGQVDVMKDWAKNMQSLAARGVDDGLIKELQQLGPKSAPEIAALNTLTDAQLVEYVSLWQQKSSEASTQAVKELEGMRQDTDKQITALRNETKVQLSAYEREWHVAIRKITDGTAAQFNAAAATMPQLGANLIAGIMNGMASMEGALMKQASDIAESVKGTIQEALDIHSPSRWGDKFIGQNLVLGIINGVTAMRAKAVATAQELSESIKEGITSDLVTADVLGYTAHSTSAINKELAVSVKVEVDGQGGGATQKIENNITVNGGGTANDNARALKRLFVQQGLGMN